MISSTTTIRQPIRIFLFLDVVCIILCLLSQWRKSHFV